MAENNGKKNEVINLTPKGAAATGTNENGATNGNPAGGTGTEEEITFLKHPIKWTKAKAKDINEKHPKVKYILGLCIAGATAVGVAALKGVFGGDKNEGEQNNTACYSCEPEETDYEEESGEETVESNEE